MAIDNSVIKIPSLMSVSSTEKMDVSSQQVTFNNGVYIFNSSLNKPLSKSLYKIWSNNNKIYLFERDSTKVETVLKDISSKVTRQRYAADNNTIEFMDADGRVLVQKLSDSLFIGDGGNNYSIYNNSPSTISKALSTSQPTTKYSTLSGAESYKGKTLNLYSLKPDILTKFSAYLNPNEAIREIIDINFFLRIKSLFTNKEITQDYYNSLVYLIANWGLFNIDPVISSDFDISKRSNTLKQTLKAPLSEQDLVLRQSIKINNASQKIFNSSNVKRLSDVYLFDTSELNGTRALSLTDRDGFLILDENTYSNYINKVFIFHNKQTNNTTAIRTSNSYTVGSANNASIGYGLAPLFNSVGGNELSLGNWNILPSERRNNITVPYDVYVYSPEQYLNFYAYDTGLLEIELDNNLTTRSEGDFYVVEIV
jgi:hypothetical protein